jgi:ABC-type ATPase with predicted acetyltransferase domain
MYTLNVRRTLDWNPPTSKRTAELIRMFGVRMTRRKEQRLHHACRLNLRDGQICCITGGSGSGKSVLLDALYEQVSPGQRIRLNEIPLEEDTALIDCVDGDLWDATGILSKAGFSDIFSMLNTPAKLSTGQQWRYRLAKALASGAKWIFADEFSASLDRITACVIAHNLRKLAGQTTRVFILASCHEDMLIDLQPDVIVIKYMNGQTRMIYKDPSQGAVW